MKLKMTPKDLTFTVIRHYHLKVVS